MQFLVKAYDGERMLDKRMEVRPRHLEGMKALGTQIICALGQRPRWNVAEELYDCAPWVRVIGDANAVGTITKATYQGHHAALDI